MLYRTTHDSFWGRRSHTVDMKRWDVSRVTDMSYMFRDSNVFNGDISNWDVSRVNNMNGMFCHSDSFNDNISKGDVSSVTTMDSMFLNAGSFDQQLCAKTWVNSKATQESMFEGSSGSISPTACKGTSDLTHAVNRVSPSPNTAREMVELTIPTINLPMNEATLCPK